MRLLISAGETSGDRLGAALIEELFKNHQDVSCFGMGGDRMEAAGLNRLVSSSDVSVVGLTEVVRKLPVIWRARRRLIRAAEMTRPDEAVLIDFPDFHFSLGAALARRGIPVVYYVSPQVWAWRAGRVATMKRFVRRVITLFPFEVDVYRRAGIDAICAGHPLADEIRDDLSIAPTPSELARRDPATAQIALMPGSRASEVRRHWPILRDAVALLRQRRPCRAFLLAAPNLPAEMFPGAGEAGIEIASGNPHRLLAGSDLLLVSSGTSTLEGALCGVPMVVIYRTSPLTFAIARRMVRVAHVALCNLVLGERIAPELLQTEATSERVAAEADRILSDPAISASMRQHWTALRFRLGASGAAARAAEAVWQALAA